MAHLREFLPAGDESIPPTKIGDGEAPVAQELRYLGSMLSKNFDDSVAIMARISLRLARIAFTNLKLQKAIFGTRRVALESKKIAYESLVLSLLLYGSECWVQVVSAENMRLLQRLHRKCIRIMCRPGSLAITLGSISSRPTRRNWRRSWASTTSGIMFIRGCWDTQGTFFVWTQTGLWTSLLQRCWGGGWQLEAASGFR